MSDSDPEHRPGHLSAILRGPSTPAGPDRTQGDEQFRALLLHLRQVFWMRDSAQGILYISPAYETVWGRTCESLYDNYDTFLDSIHPDDRERVVAAMTNSATAGGHDQEYRISRPDGEMRWIWARSYPVPSEQGSATLFAGIAEDITERKAAAVDRARLAAIIEYSDDAIVTISVDGIVIGWNQGAESYYGYTAEEIVGRSILMLFPPDRYQEYLRLLKTVRNGEPVPAYDTVRRRKDGTLINVSLGISPIEALDGEVVGASKISHDITRIKTLEARLGESEKVKLVGQLAAGIAHDFNNLLTAILGYTELVLVDVGSADPHRGDLEQVCRAARRAGELTSQLLAFSRQQILQPTVVDLNVLVADTVTLLRRVIGEDIELVVSLEPSLGRLKVDPGQIEQVIMNLALNARDAMPGGGRLTLETMNVDGDRQFCLRHGLAGAAGGQRLVALVVTDTGTGMDGETRERIFEPFFTTKSKGKGTGLGLATVHGIVNQSHGAIVVASEPGAGATFTVYLPRTDEDFAAAAVPTTTVAATDGTETILLVEDEDAVRLLSRTLLTRRGYRVIEAADAEQALARAAEEGGRIHLVVTDVVLPGMSGAELVGHLIALRPTIKVLFCSGYSVEAFASRGLLTAGAPFLQKPFTAAGLTRKVRDILDAPVGSRHDPA